MIEPTVTRPAENPVHSPGDAESRRGSLIRGAAWVVVMAGPFFAILSTIALLSGSLWQRYQGGTLLALLAYSLPSCAALLFATFRARDRAYGQAAIISVLGGALAFADLVVAALSAGYANPCFEQASCTAGPTFGYTVLTASAFGFLIATAVGVILGPIAIVILARRHRDQGHRRGF